MLIESKAKLRYVSIPPRKMRLVADLVKGMPVEKALGVLNFTPRIAAAHMAKTVKSAAANALSQEGTDRLKPENLVIKNITVDDAPTAKRIRYQSMGRVFRYRKRFCHLTILLEGKLDAPSQAPKKATKSKKAAEEDTDTTTKKAAADTKTSKKAKPKAKPRAKNVSKVRTQAMPKTHVKSTAKPKGDRG